jgi:hypothetical protein
MAQITHGDSKQNDKSQKALGGWLSAAKKLWILAALATQYTMLRVDATAVVFWRQLDQVLYLAMRVCSRVKVPCIES